MSENKNEKKGFLSRFKKKKETKIMGLDSEAAEKNKAEMLAMIAAQKRSQNHVDKYKNQQQNSTSKEIGV